MPADLARRLAAYAAWHGRTEQDIVADALEPVLAGFYVAHRGDDAPVRPSLVRPPEAAPEAA